MRPHNVFKPQSKPVPIKIKAFVSKEYAQSICTPKNKIQCIQFWIDFLPLNPKLALHYFAQYNDPIAHAYSALIYFSEPKLKN